MQEDEKMAPRLLTPLSVREVLRQSPFQAIRRLWVEETESEVIVAGSVPSYYLKQQAQESLLPLLGTRTLRNCVVVAFPAANHNGDRAAPGRGFS